MLLHAPAFISPSIRECSADVTTLAPVCYVEKQRSAASFHSGLTDAKDVSRMTSNVFSLSQREAERRLSLIPSVRDLTGAVKRITNKAPMVNQSRRGPLRPYHKPIFQVHRVVGALLSLRRTKERLPLKTIYRSERSTNNLLSPMRSARG
jgi:hypothetical protein